jgi:transcriptional regulator with XRE-family HTH domain
LDAGWYHGSGGLKASGYHHAATTQVNDLWQIISLSGWNAFPVPLRERVCLLRVALLMTSADTADRSPGHQNRGRFVDGATFGAFLQNHREGRNLSLHDIAAETKIAERHLAALERGDIQSWPGGLYRRAMVRAYATVIGLDPDATVCEFVDAFQEEIAPAVPLPSVEPHPAHTLLDVRSRASLYVGLGLCAAIFALGWAARTSDAAGAIAPVRVEHVSTDVHAVATAPVSTSGLAAPPDAATFGTRQALATVMPASAAPSDESPAIAHASMRVISEPAGARVTVNGIGWGQTPVTVRHLTPGEKHVRISKDGYISVERQLHVSPDTPTQAVRVSLEPES